MRELRGIINIIRYDKWNNRLILSPSKKPKRNESIAKIHPFKLYLRLSPFQIQSAH